MMITFLRFLAQMSLFEFIRRKRRRWAYHFYLVRFRPWDPTKTLDIGRRRSICFHNAQSE
eukprot:UN00148